MLARNHQLSSIHSLLVFVAMTALCWAALSNDAEAQRYDTIQLNVNEREGKTLGRNSDNALKNQSVFQQNGKQAIDKYYKDYFFRKFTQTGATDLAEIGDLRDDLLKRLRNTPVKAAQDHLTNVTLGATKLLVSRNYHPAVRFNAVLLLGALDKQYPSGDNPPIVLPAATNELLTLLEAEEIEGVKVHPSVKAGALEGLERHVRYGLDAQYAERVTKAALAMLSQDPKKLDVDADVNNWIKCQAARVLARQYKDGPTSEVHAALTALIADEKVGLADRCCVSGLLKLVTYTPGAEADAKETLVPLGNLTKSVVKEGADVARDFQSIILGEKRVPRRPGGFRGGEGETGPKFERRALLSRLVQIRDGARSLSNGLADAEKQQLEGLTALITPVITQSKDEDTFDVDLIREVFKLENSMDSLIASWQPAAAAPAPDDVDFAE